MCSPVVFLAFVQMPGYQIANIWPFVVNAPLWITQVYLIVYGENITYS